MHEDIFMKEALRLARQGMLAGAGGPFGAVVVWNDQIIGRGYDRVTSTNDPTAHAELIAIREACRHLGSFHLRDCVIYSSCEPCPMCMAAIYLAQPKKLIYGASRELVAKAGFEDATICEDLARPADQRRLSTEQYMSEAAANVLQEWIRKEDKVKY